MFRKKSSTVELNLLVAFMNPEMYPIVKTECSQECSLVDTYESWTLHFRLPHNWIVFNA